MFGSSVGVEPHSFIHFPYQRFVFHSWCRTAAECLSNVILTVRLVFVCRTWRGQRMEAAADVPTTG